MLNHLSDPFTSDSSLTSTFQLPSPSFPQHLLQHQALCRARYAKPFTKYTILQVYVTTITTTTTTAVTPQNIYIRHLPKILQGAQTSYSGYTQHPVALSQHVTTYQTTPSPNKYTSSPELPSTLPQTDWLTKPRDI